MCGGSVVRGWRPSAPARPRQQRRHADQAAEDVADHRLRPEAGPAVHQAAAGAGEAAVAECRPRAVDEREHEAERHHLHDGADGVEAAVEAHPLRDRAAGGRGSQHRDRLDERPAVVRRVAEVAAQEVVGDVQGGADQAPRPVEDAGDARDRGRRPHGREVVVVVERKADAGAQPEQQCHARQYREFASNFRRQHAGPHGSPATASGRNAGFSRGAVRKADSPKNSPKIRPQFKHRRPDRKILRFPATPDALRP